ncbi:hypothetical protein CKAH01_04445 [Colletotrichum kahawae]|uniref:Uncharacterized protein n=1 Tax=Colletotrichum kahawae TaxID=34407 RepID=A0AAE0DBV4_COLKA|nr:hypothetical protein CKAH01_04445 [Colletotrichum kahawae]
MSSITESGNSHDGADGSIVDTYDRERCQLCLAIEGLTRDAGSRSDGAHSGLLSAADPSPDGGTKHEGNSSMEHAAIWHPMWLRPVVLSAFIALFLVFAFGLVTMLQLSHRNNGLVQARPSLFYLWRFGPTAVLTIVSIFWSRVEMQALRYMPWIAYGHTQSLRTNSHDFDLDYTSMFSPTILIQSLRRRHYLVFLVVVISVVLKIQIVLAPGLYSLEVIEVTEKVDIEILDLFNTTKEAARSLETSPYYMALAIHTFDMQPPFGVNQHVAYQTFQNIDGSRGSVHERLEAVVDGVLCSSRSWTSEVKVVDDGINPIVTPLTDKAKTPVIANLWDLMRFSSPTDRSSWSGTAGWNEVNFNVMGGPVRDAVAFHGIPNDGIIDPVLYTNEIFYLSVMNMSHALGPWKFEGLATIYDESGYLYLLWTSIPTIIMLSVALLASPGNKLHTIEPCGIEFDDPYELPEDFYHSPISWAEVPTEVHLTFDKGEYVLDPEKPPHPDLSKARPWSPPFDVPHVDGVFGDASQEEDILNDVHHQYGFLAAQLANVENRFDITGHSMTNPPPSLPALEAIAIDNGRRRLIQDPTVTYILVAILSLVVIANMWVLAFAVTGLTIGRPSLFQMKMEGLAPVGFNSMAAMVALLRNSNIPDRLPGHINLESSKELYQQLSGLGFRMGWFWREATQTRHYTIGVMGDEDFKFMGSKEHTEKERLSIIGKRKSRH